MTSTVLITGASRGLGYELVRRFLADGWRVCAGVRRMPCESLDRLAAQYPSQLTVVGLDVADTASAQSAAAAVARTNTSLDICINNAAISTTERFGTLESLDFNEARSLYDTNALGALRVLKAFLPLLRAGKSPVLVNISSEAGQIAANPRGGEFEYCMSKAALNMATQLLRQRLQQEGVRVLALHPGWIRTDMGGQDACGDPADAAASLVDVIEKHRSDLDGHAFFDWQGLPLDW
jgi:NAD(P)-dependent dehydrogenase (short-subunit alcohol dehydrogenase family)